MAAPRKYPQDVRDRAVRMVREAREDPQRRRGALVRVATQLGVNKETLRNWVKQADIDDGQRPGTTTDQAEELAQLRAENAELRRANEILKSASAYAGDRVKRFRRRVG